MSSPDRLRVLREDLDREVLRLSSLHAERLACRRGCADCCVDGLSVFEVEAEAIRTRHPELLAHGAPHPPGACAFLDADGACRVYEVRPYVCRTQGLPLAWEDEDEDGEPVEARDICPLNEAGGPPLEALPAEDCFRLGPFEGRLATLQAEAQGRFDGLARVALRALFQRGG
jgi:Fe-S-cluster containining protein